VTYRLTAPGPGPAAQALLTNTCYNCH